MESTYLRICNCTGIRYCSQCKDPIYRQQFRDLYPIPDHVKLAILTYKQCQNCRQGLFLKGYQGEQNCQLHDSDYQKECFNGFIAIQNFIPLEQEEQIIKYLESFQWIESQSGRKKLDFGPKANYKKKKVKQAQFKGFPLFIKNIFDLLKTSDNSIIKDRLKGFIPIELNVLDYDEKRGSNIARHFDDFWLWGERIVGINMLSDTVMSFTKQYDDKLINIEIPVPIRCLYIIGGSSRYQWMHGIKSEHIKGRRVVITIRELSQQFSEQNNEIAQKLKEVSSNYI